MKKILMLCCVLFVLMPFQAFAHSKLTESIPVADETISETPEHISLKYNTSISSVSTFTLVNEQGEEQPVQNITVQDNELSGEVASSLANGTYHINWNIIGADGHAIEGVTTFTVLAEEVSPTDAVDNSKQNNASTEPDAHTTEPTVEPTPEATASVDTDTSSNEESEYTLSESNKNTVVWLYVVIGLLVVVGLVFAIRNRK